MVVARGLSESTAPVKQNRIRTDYRTFSEEDPHACGSPQVIIELETT